MIYKTLAFEIEEKVDAGGRIRISTSVIDRDRDRVLPSGALIENYMRNPVVQWAHDYRSPWATIGRTKVKYGAANAHSSSLTSLGYAFRSIRQA